MPRIRSVKPEFFDDEKLGKLPVLTRFIYIGIWVQCCDDYGVFRWSPRKVWGSIFPHDENVSVEDVRDSLETLAKLSRVARYTVDGETYGYVLRWKQHQRVDKPGKRRMPAYDAAVHAEQCSDSSNPRETLATLSGDSREDSAVGSRTVGSRTVGSRNPPNPPSGGTAGEQDVPVKQRRGKKERPELDTALISLWQESTGEAHRESAAKHGKARLNAGHSQEQLRIVAIWCRHSKQWDRQREGGYLRPSTVWGGAKFEEYLVAAEKAQRTKQQKTSGREIGWVPDIQGHWRKKRRDAAIREGLGDVWRKDKPEAA